MTCWGDNVLSLRVDGTFDDCQRIGQGGFPRSRLEPSGTGSAPPTASISAGCCRRWCTTSHRVSRSPRRTGTKPSYIIPAGNLGNALRGASGRAPWDFPLARIILAHNINRTVPDFLETGNGSLGPASRRWPRPWMSETPATWSACVRCIRHWAAIREQLSADSVDDATIRARIGEDFMQYGREWCPHTATAAEVYSRLSAAERRDQPWVVVATAHPAKFNEIVEPIIGKPVAVPAESRPAA